jgi:hypothetical protein
MTEPEKRCLTSAHSAWDDETRKLRKGALENRYGPQVALVGPCQHRKLPIDSVTLLV